jgi:methylated-DNA-[protein]-cysteine S-methyltransferase
LRIQTIMQDHAVGPIHMVAEGGRLLAMEFGDVEHRLMPMLRSRFGKEPMLESEDDLSEITSAIRAYFEGDLAAIDAIEVDGGGTEFQRHAWQSLRAIPPGETRTYGQMAAALGRPNAARAVGMANALNPISLVVPCHRLVGSNGSLTGYGGGIERKRWLIDHERRHASQIQLPVVA